MRGNGKDKRRWGFPVSLGLVVFFFISFFLWGMFKVYSQLQTNAHEQVLVDGSLQKLRTTLDTDLLKFRSEISQKIQKLEMQLAQSRERFVPEPSPIVPRPRPGGGDAEGKIPPPLANLVRTGAAEPLPCLLTRTATSPQFRICTLDPSLDKTSRVIHSLDGKIELTEHWPLSRLLNSAKNGLVVDVGAGIGYISLRASSLGSRVISVEHDVALVGLLRESVKLNSAEIKKGYFGPVRVISGAASASASFDRDEITVDGVVGLKDVHLLHIASRGNGEIAVLNGCTKMLKEKRVRYILLELCPQKATKAGLKPLKTLREIQGYGYNIFDDATAEDGALTGPELVVLLHGIGAGCKNIFIARAM